MATPIAILAFGLLHDVLSEMPIGFWGVLMTGFFVIARGQTRFLIGAPLGPVWFTFAAMTMMTHVAAYIIALIHSGVHGDFGAVMASGILTALLFPPLFVFLEWLTGDTDMRKE